MSIKYYSLLFLVFCVLTCGGFYALNSESAEIVLWGLTCNLPVAVWLVLFLSSFYVISLFFFTGGWIQKYLFDYRQNRDFERLIEQISNQILQKETKTPVFKTPSYQMLSKILFRLHLKPNFTSLASQNAKIDHLFLELDELEKGNVIKRDFEKNTYFWEKNLQNQMNANPKFAQKIFEETADKPLKEFALNVLLQNNAMSEKMIINLLKSELEAPIARELLMYFLQKGYQLGLKDFASLIFNSKLSSSSYIELAKQIKTPFDPDFCIALFDQLAQQDSKARLAYVFVLLDFSMKDKAKEFLIENDDLLLPKLYLQMQEEGKNPPLEIFFPQR